MASCVFTPPEIHNGYISSIGAGKNKVKIVVVKGTPYEMGVQLGVLLNDEIEETMDEFFDYTEKHVPNLSVNKVLDEAWQTNSKFIDRRVIDEMKGVADGSGASLNLLKRCHMIPVVSPYSCSGIIIWGDATKNGHTYQIRNLDYSMGAGLQDHPVVVIYIPTNGAPHANVTFAGYIASHTGINANHIVFGEKGQSPKNEFPYNLSGAHFSFLFRTLEYDAKTLSGALDTIKTTPLIKRYYLFIGDGNEKKSGGAKVLVSSPNKNKLSIFKAKDANDKFVPQLFDNCVYYTMKNKKAAEFINEYFGKFDEKTMIQLSKIVAAERNLINVVYDATTLEMWVAYANGTSRAANQEYVHIDLKKFFE